MKKDLKVLRKAYVYEACVKLCYMIENKEGTRQDFTSLSRDIFPSLTKKEIEENFKEKFKETGIVEEFWTGIEISVKVEKDKEEIKKTHNQVMQVLKDVFSELEKKEKEKGLNNWLWRKKEFELD